MKCRPLLLGVTAMVAVAMADVTDDRARIAGRWQSEASPANDSEIWIFEVNEDRIHATRKQNEKTLSEFDCATNGRECTAKNSGEAAKVSLWYDGPKLVQMETRGSRILKRLYSTSEQGSVLEVEEVPVVPGGKPKVTRFKRAPDK